MKCRVEGLDCGLPAPWAPTSRGRRLLPGQSANSPAVRPRAGPHQSLRADAFLTPVKASIVQLSQRDKREYNSSNASRGPFTRAPTNLWLNRFSMETLADNSRRALIRAGGLTVAAAIGAVFGPHGPITAAVAQQQTGKSQRPDHAVPRAKATVTPPEDLMREHGVLERVLLIYEAGMRKFELHDDFDPVTLVSAAQIIHEFIEDYHELSEEQHVFPRFKKAGKMVQLIDTLLQQHEAGRRLTQTIVRAAPLSRRPGEPRRQLVSAMRMFTAMYRSHAAREDTDLFPKLRGLVSPNEYDAMAEEFEKEEHRRFGDDGFGKIVDRLARLEHAIGVYDLDQFTPL